MGVDEVGGEKRRLVKCISTRTCTPMNTCIHILVLLQVFSGPFDPEGKQFRV